MASAAFVQTPEDRFRILGDALVDEFVRQNELLELGREKQRALIDGDMKKIDQLTQREEAMVIAVGEAASRRMTLTVETGKMVSLEEHEISVSRIAEHAGEPLRSRLLSSARDLKQTVQELMKVNRQNKALTEQSISYIKDFMNVLGGGMEPAVTYTKRGVEKKGSVSRVMIDHLA